MMAELDYLSLSKDPTMGLSNVFEGHSIIENSAIREDVKGSNRISPPMAFKSRLPLKDSNCGLCERHETQRRVKSKISRHSTNDTWNATFSQGNFGHRDFLKECPKDPSNQGKSC
jgi:hypothetical protein